MSVSAHLNSGKKNVLVKMSNFLRNYEKFNGYIYLRPSYKIMMALDVSII